MPIGSSLYLKRSLGDRSSAKQPQRDLKWLDEGIIYKNQIGIGQEIIFLSIVSINYHYLAQNHC